MRPPHIAGGFSSPLFAVPRVLTRATQSQRLWRRWYMLRVLREEPYGSTHASRAIAGAMLLASAVALSVGKWLLAVVLLGAFVIWFVQSGTGASHG